MLSTTGTSHCAMPDRVRQPGGAPIIVWHPNRAAAVPCIGAAPTGYVLLFHPFLIGQFIACRRNEEATHPWCLDPNIQPAAHAEPENSTASRTPVPRSHHSPETLLANSELCA